jgi:hypothetical protein
MHAPDIAVNPGAETGAYGCYLAHKRAITEMKDLTLVCEGDCLLKIPRLPSPER